MKIQCVFFLDLFVFLLCLKKLLNFRKKLALKKRKYYSGLYLMLLMGNPGWVACFCGHSTKGRSMAVTYDELAEKCREIRYDLMDMLGHLGVGHVGGSLSAVDAMVMVYYKYMRIDPKNPKKEGRDRFFMSKGHGGPALYAVLANKGYFPKEMLYTLNQGGTNLPSHPDMRKTPGVDMTTGSLGQGLSCAVGAALASRYRKDGARMFALIGDGESQEGQIWEAAMYASHMKLGNLIAFTDYNNLQIDGYVCDMCDLDPLDKKWSSFGWHAVTIDGHSLEAIDKAIEAAIKVEDKPSMIILKTVKGKGVTYIEKAAPGNHSMPVSPEERAMALEELKAGGK